MIKSMEYVREGLRHGLGGSSKSQEGSSSLLSFRGSLFRLEPICSMEELWFLVVLDSDSYYPAFSLGLRALVMAVVAKFKFCSYEIRICSMSKK